MKQWYTPSTLEVGMSMSDKFWGRVAERYAKRPVSDEAAYQKKLAETQSSFRPDAVRQVRSTAVTGAIENVSIAEDVLSIGCANILCRGYAAPLAK